MLKSLAKMAKHVLGFRSFDILLSNGAFLDFFYRFTYFCRKIFMSRFTHFFRRFFVTEKQTPQTFTLLECMLDSPAKKNATWISSKFGQHVVPLALVPNLANM